ncbi:MAG: hypothetical protein Q6J68_04940 [Thermostichales cyanobacterium SZTDM-1c_bins_54]
MASTHPKVSRDVQQLLEQLLAEHPHSCLEELGDAIGNWKLLADYDFCLWWQGCYYCRDPQGDWKQITCHI